MNTTTHTAKRLSNTTYQYRGFVITKSITKYSARTSWLYTWEGKECRTYTLKHAKVVVDFLVECAGY
jgi:hypothetical protein